MANRELTNKLSSGEILQMRIGGVGAGDLVPTMDDVNLKADQTDLDTNTAALAILTPLNDFFYDKVSVPVTVANAVYEPIVSISETKLAGTYQVTQSLLYSLDSASNSVYFRFSVDNGATWTEVNNEPKDTTNKMPLTSSYVLVHAGGTMSIRIEAKKENAADVFVIYTADLMVDRKI